MGLVFHLLSIAATDSDLLSFNHFKVKVGGSVEDDRRRLALVRGIIDDPKEFEGRAPPAPETLVGKNAGPTGSVLMIDANQVSRVSEFPVRRLRGALN